MKNKKPYKKLINKIFYKTLISLVIAVFIFFLFRFLVQGQMGNLITKIISDSKGLDWDAARMFYFNNIRRYYEYIMIAAVMLLFVFFYRAFVSWFTKYFDKMIEGVNSLVSKEKKISMPDELKFMEDKLKSIKLELERSKEMERELEKQKNDLIVYLAHDIKTPLTSVMGYLNLLSESSDISIEKKTIYLHIALEKAGRLEKLINEFFEIAQYNLRSVPLHKTTIDLSYMMVQIVDEVYPSLQTQGKKIIVKIPDDLTIYADSDKMARVFNNILRNAINYSKEKSIIEITAKTIENDVEIRFVNSGVISKEEINNIFNKFYRIDTARRTYTGGAGLGLAIAKDIVALHDGTITAYCEGNSTILAIKIPAEFKAI